MIANDAKDEKSVLAIDKQGHAWRSQGFPELRA